MNPNNALTRVSDIIVTCGLVLSGLAAATFVGWIIRIDPWYALPEAAYRGAVIVAVLALFLRVRNMEGLFAGWFSDRALGMAVISCWVVELAIVIVAWLIWLQWKDALLFLVALVIPTWLAGNLLGGFAWTRLSLWLTGQLETIRREDEEEAQ